MSTETSIDPNARWINTSSALADFRRSIQAEKDSERADQAAFVANLKDGIQTTSTLLKDVGIPTTTGALGAGLAATMLIASGVTATSDTAASNLIAGPLTHLDKMSPVLRYLGSLGYAGAASAFLMFSKQNLELAYNKFREIIR